MMNGLLKGGLSGECFGLLFDKGTISHAEISDNVKCLMLSPFEYTLVMNPNLVKRFSGLSNLYSKRALQTITQSHVVVIGVGGVGSWAVEALARNAIGAITMIDMDLVSESNINRQLPALSSTLGRDKTAVLKDRILDINPECKVTIVDDFVTLENVAEIRSSEVVWDYVIECVDSFRVKAAIIRHCKRNKLPVTTVGGAGGQIDPLKIKQVDLSRTQHDALFSKTRKILRQDYGFARNPKRVFSIPCVYSDEQIRYPDGQGGITMEKPEGSEKSGLSCAGGIGSSMQVTASFGLTAVAYVINCLIEAANVEQIK